MSGTMWSKERILDPILSGSRLMHFMNITCLCIYIYLYLYTYIYLYLYTYSYPISYIIPETKSLPPENKLVLTKGKSNFQTLIFRGYVSFWECVCIPCILYNNDWCLLQVASLLQKHSSPSLCISLKHLQPQVLEENIYSNLGQISPEVPHKDSESKYLGDNPLVNQLLGAVNQGWMEGWNDLSVWWDDRTCSICMTIFKAICNWQVQWLGW